MVAHIHLADPVFYIPAVQPGLAPLGVVIMLEANVDVRQDPKQSDLIEHTIHDKSILDDIESDRPVHRSTVYVRVVQVMRQVLRQRALSATAESVYGDGDPLHVPGMLRPR